MKSVISTLAAAAATLALAACSGGPSLPSLSTGSVSGDTAQPTQTATANAAATATPGAPAAPTAGTPIATPAAQPEPVKSTPTLRAYQVGTTSARAVKCGFYFDATQLKQQFLADEAAQGTAIADMASVDTHRAAMAVVLRPNRPATRNWSPARMKQTVNRQSDWPRTCARFRN